MRSIVHSKWPTRLRLSATLVAAAATIGLLSALPTARAQASTPTITLPPPSQVESLLGEAPVEAIDPAQLAQALSQLEGFEGLPQPQLREALEKLIEGLSGEGAVLEQLLGREAAAELQTKLLETLGPLASKLEELLGGNPQAKIEEALGSTPAGEVIGKLLSGSSEPQALLEQILQALGAERLQSLLGTILSGEAFSKKTIEELAGQLGTTPTALAAELGKSAEELPPAATALVAPLANGDLLGVVPSAKGVTVGLIDKAGEAVGGEGGGSGGSGSGGSGGNGSGGGNGGLGGSGTPGATVLVSGGTPAPAPTGSVAGTSSGKLKILSHRVRRRAATVVLQVPSAGTLIVSGHGLRRISRQTSKGERVTIHPVLTKAQASTLRRHHRRRLSVPLKVTFQPVAGAASSASVKLAYR